MGLLDILGLGAPTADLLTAGQGIVSPWADQGNLQSVVWSDVLGDDIVERLPLTRAEAISIPAVSKARNLLVGTIAKWPLVSARYDREAKVDTDTTRDHPWLYRTSGPVTPYSRMVWTVDDAIFYGCSLWIVERGAEQAGRRPITDAAWCPFDWWHIEDGGFYVDEGGDPSKRRRLARDEYLFFDFPFEGLLNVATRTLRGARDQERSWVGRAKNPIPLIDLHRTEDVELTDPELEQLVEDWAKARTNTNGAIGSTPQGIELRVHGDVAVDLMIEGRNAVRTDVGSFLNVRAAMLDGTVGIDSLTYTTKEGERNAFFEFDLPFWTDPIEARLSLDDVVPRGQRVRFEKYQETPEPIGPGVED